MQTRIQIAEAFKFLLMPSRYKVAYGGRGSGKSWHFAIVLLIEAARRPLRILCAREVQKSIKESVHRLLSDQIQAANLGGMFDVLETEIRSKNGSLFSFVGLAQHTVESVKSYEGYDIVWIEEAQTVSKKSWDILIPTIRKPGSEIWVSFNPSLDSDDTWKRFVESPPPNCVTRKVNYSENPWFPMELEQERTHCEITSPDDYRTIWLGECRATVSGAIYAGEVQSAITEGRIDRVPYDPRLKVHTVWDLGWNDAMSIALVQRGRSDIRIIDYIEDSHKTLDHYVARLKDMRMNWGHDWLPHDGATKDFKTGRSTADFLRSFGRSVRMTPNIGVEAGIREVRMLLARTWFDKTKSSRLIECLKRYRRAVPQTTGEPGAPIHDEYSHGADCMRYVAVVADKLSNEDERTKTTDPMTFGFADAAFGY